MASKLVITSIRGVRLTSDLMVVVGSKKSANTTHLAQLLKAITQTIHIEDENELDAVAPISRNFWKEK